MEPGTGSAYREPLGARVPPLGMRGREPTFAGASVRRSSRDWSLKERLPGSDLGRRLGVGNGYLKRKPSIFLPFSFFFRTFLGAMIVWGHADGQYDNKRDDTVHIYLPVSVE